jgi:hypothetical protein
MKEKISRLFLLVLILSCASARAQDAPQTPRPNSSERKPIIDSLRAPGAPLNPARGPSVLIRVSLPEPPPGYPCPVSQLVRVGPVHNQTRTAEGARPALRASSRARCSTISSVTVPMPLAFSVKIPLLRGFLFMMYICKERSGRFSPLTANCHAFLG